MPRKLALFDTPAFVIRAAKVVAAQWAGETDGDGRPRWSQEQIGGLLGVAQQTVADWLNISTTGAGNTNTPAAVDGQQPADDSNGQANDEPAPPSRRRAKNVKLNAVAEAKRAKLSQEYAAELAKMKAEAAGRKAQAAGKPRGEKKSHPEQVTEENRTDRETSTVRARAVGTNRRYLEAAEKLAASGARPSARWPTPSALPPNGPANCLAASAPGTLGYVHTPPVWLLTPLTWTYRNLTKCQENPQDRRLSSWGCHEPSWNHWNHWNLVSV